MRSYHLLPVLLVLAACGGGSGRATGPISEACLSADRARANGALCSCVQLAANRTLSGNDQRRAARFFDDPDRAQETRTSDNPSTEAFWRRYREFVETAEASCG